MFLNKINKYLFTNHSNKTLKGFILFGAPGAGKGTYGKLIQKDFNLLKLAPGDIIRHQLSKDKLTDELKQIKQKVEQGQLVDDATIMKLVIKEYDENISNYNGVIFDGVPRNDQQIKMLKQNFDISKMKVINVLLREDILIEKLTSRRVCNTCGENYNLADIQRDGYEMEPLLPKKEGICDQCNGKLVTRKDDTKEVIQYRLDIYKKNTLHLLDILTKQLELSKIDFDPRKGKKDYPKLKKKIEEELI